MADHKTTIYPLLMWSHGGSDPQHQTVPSFRWTMEELGMIFSVRDQIALNRRCERQLGSLCQASFTNPCCCLADAVSCVAHDLMKAESNER